MGVLGEWVVSYGRGTPVVSEKPMCPALRGTCGVSKHALWAEFRAVGSYRGISLISSTHPPKITIGP